MNARISRTSTYKAPAQILETVLYAEELERAREFYAGILDLEVVSEVHGRHLFFRLRDSMLLVFRPDSTRRDDVAVDGNMIPKHGTGDATHVAFRVDEAELPALKQRLVSHGVGIESEIAWPAGGRSLYCRDPHGNSIEFATASLWFS